MQRKKQLSNYENQILKTKTSENNSDIKKTHFITNTSRPIRVFIIIVSSNIDKFDNKETISQYIIKKGMKGRTKTLAIIPIRLTCHM